MQQGVIMKEVLHEIGRLSGSMEALTESTKNNTAEIKIFNQYMHTSKGAAEQKEKDDLRRHKKTFWSSLGSSTGIAGLIEGIFHWAIK